MISLFVGIFGIIVGIWGYSIGQLNWGGILSLILGGFNLAIGLYKLAEK